MYFSIVAILFTILACFHPKVFAIYDPLSVPNNKYGIHIAELTDLPDAAALVNSQNGDWGYVTLVIEDGDKNVGKWQEIMNQMRRLHLIPIVRVATHAEGSSWKIPQKEDAKRWADFLNSLNWPIENRYIILFNEPNHSKEWGNSINPEEYADVALAYAKELKGKSDDFFILPAGLDMSASSDGEALEGGEFLRRMYTAKPELFSSIDGWTSHSYPNPGFSGSPYGTGKGSIASFQWELSYLQSLGMTRKLPVFITETGWVQKAMGNNLAVAASGVWSDTRIAAITPFLLNYQGYPFDIFSWKKLGSPDFYPHFTLYQELSKIKGNPKQKESYTLASPLLPDRLVMNSTYTLSGMMTNTGQGIVNPKDGYTLVFSSQKDMSTYIADSLPILEPKETGPIRIHLKTPDIEGVWHVALAIAKGEKSVLLKEKDIILIPPPTLDIKVTLGWQKQRSDDTATVLVYDVEDHLLHKFPNVKISHGEMIVTGLYNMVPGTKYRIVVTIPYYLPRQTTITLLDTATRVVLKRFIPLDFNGDGALNIKDLPALFTTSPHTVIGRIF